MAVVKTITQGGQVHIHQLMMLKQVVIAGVVVALVSGLACFVWKAQNLLKPDWRMASEVWWAQFMIATNPVENHARLTQMYTPPFKREALKGKTYKRSCFNIIRDPFLKQVTQRIELLLVHIIYQSLKFAGLMFMAVMGLWFFMGRAHKKPHHQRGNRLVPWQSLKP